MYRLPSVTQGYSRVFGKVRPDEAKRAVEWACKKLEESPGSKRVSIKYLQGASWGVQQEFHTGGRYPASGKSLCGNAYEEWSEDIACVLQGTCLPGSTMYCRTKSMFGKLEMRDVMQGTSSTSSRMMSTCSAMMPGTRAIHTVAALETTKLITSKKDGYSHANGTRASIRMKSGLHQEFWDEDIACVLQGTCLPGSTRYCRTKSMFGSLQLDDVLQGDCRRLLHRAYSTQASPGTDPGGSAGTQLTQRARLKQAVRDYGSTVVVFHVCISLMSLGGFYLAVSSGLDMQSLLTSIGFSSEVVSSRITTGTSTFLVAYGVHKLFAPVRIAITLTCTPFIVRYLRGIGFLKAKPATLPK